MRKLLSAAGMAAGTLLSAAVGYLYKVARDARKRDADHCDYLLILGGDVIGADKPSPQLKARMQAAKNYLTAHPQTVAIPCGGCFRKGQKKSEARIIADFLTANGIDPARLWLEEASTTTYENFRNAFALLRARTGRDPAALDLAFLSSSYHIHRARLLARSCGCLQIGHVACRTPGCAVLRFLRELIVAVEIPVRLLQRKRQSKMF